MKQANETYDELLAMGSPLAGLPRSMPYHVPAGYFEGLSAALSENDPVVSVGSKAMPYTVPPGYFAELPAAVLSTVHIENTASLPRPVPFDIPSGYFDKLPTHVMAGIKTAEETKQPAKRISIGFRWQRWAAAAALLISVGVGTYFTLRYAVGSGSTENVLASVPNKEIQDYLQITYRVDVANVENNNVLNNIQIDNKDIVQYLNETGWDIVD